MTSRTCIDARRRPASRIVPRALVVACLASMALTGCVSVLGKKTRVHSAEPAAVVPQDPLSEAHTRADADTAHAYWLYRTAQLQVAADSLDAARRSLSAALEREPYDAPSLALASRLDYRAGRHREAIERLEKARAHPEEFADGFPPALLAGLALHYDAIDRLDRVRAIVADPAWRDQPATRAATGYLALRGDIPDSTFDSVKDAVGREPNSAVHQNNHGIVRLRAGDPDGARRAFRAAIERDPKLPGPYYNLALLETYYAADDSAGRHWFERYWALSHDDPDRLGARFGKSATPQTAGVPAGGSRP